VEVVGGPEVRVGIDVAGHDGAAAHVDLPRAGRDLDASARADRLDPVVAHDHDAVVDHLVSPHRDDARAGEREHSAGMSRSNSISMRRSAGR
jgi:hypothetical protein